MKDLDFDSILLAFALLCLMALLGGCRRERVAPPEIPWAVVNGLEPRLIYARERVQFWSGVRAEADNDPYLMR